MGLKFNADEKKLIRKLSVPEGLEEDHFKWYIYTCEKLELSPLLNQIHLVIRTSRYKDRDGVWKDGKKTPSIQVGIDGFRVLAERSGEYAGQDAPIYHYMVENKEEGGWKMESGQVVPPDGRLVACTITAYRAPKGDFSRKYPISSTCYVKEYIQTKKDGTPTVMWNKMNFTMIAKCTEAVNFRKGFPYDLSGVYIAEELAKAAELEQEAATAAAEEDKGAKEAQERAKDATEKVSEPAADVSGDATETRSSKDLCPICQSEVPTGTMKDHMAVHETKDEAEKKGVQKINEKGDKDKKQTGDAKTEALGLKELGNRLTTALRPSLGENVGNVIKKYLISLHGKEKFSDIPKPALVGHLRQMVDHLERKGAPDLVNLMKIALSRKDRPGGEVDPKAKEGPKGKKTSADPKKKKDEPKSKPKPEDDF